MTKAMTMNDRWSEDENSTGQRQGKRIQFFAFVKIYIKKNLLSMPARLVSIDFILYIYIRGCSALFFVSKSLMRREYYTHCTRKLHLRNSSKKHRDIHNENGGKIGWRNCNERKRNASGIEFFLRALFFFGFLSFLLLWCWGSSALCYCCRPLSLSLALLLLLPFVYHVIAIWLKSNWTWTATAAKKREKNEKRWNWNECSIIYLLF